MWLLVCTWEISEIFDILSKRYRGRLNKAGIKKVHNIIKVLIHLSQMKKNMQPRRPPRDCTL